MARLTVVVRQRRSSNASCLRCGNEPQTKNDWGTLATYTTMINMLVFTHGCLNSLIEISQNRQKEYRSHQNFTQGAGGGMSLHTRCRGVGARSSLHTTCHACTHACEISSLNMKQCHIYIYIYIFMKQHKHVEHLDHAKPYIDKTHHACMSMKNARGTYFSTHRQPRYKK